jgi:3,4-dihydroxy 2-butanone 4-phosphate synthase/GTP cyclohydrolase II
MADPIQEVLQAFSHGELVVVTDDEDREGEGDLIVAASLCTADKMAFIIRHTSGIVCAPITTEDARRLRLDPMVAHNESNHTTAFTVSIDYKPDGGTGISADERASCCRALANPNAGANDFARPGHVFPLIAASHKLKHVTIADMIAYRQAREKLIERVSTFTTDSPIGPLQGYAYRSPFDSIAHVAFVYNGIGDGKNVLTRFHKPNIVRDIFTGHKRMQAVLEHFKKAGSGVLVYLRDGAAGVPVAPLPEETSAEADRNKQWREVGVGAQILRDLGVTSIRHLTSSTHDYKGLSGFGIEIVSNEQLEG